MKRLNQLTNKEGLSYILQSPKLSDKFETYICRGNLDYIDEKLNCFSSVEYSITLYGRNYFRVTNPLAFIDDINDCTKKFGCSDKLYRLITHCDKLWGNNLYSYYINKLARLFYLEEIKPILQHLEDIQGAIYDKDSNNEELIERASHFINCCCDNVYINSTGEMIKIEKLC